MYLRAGCDEDILCVHRGVGTVIQGHTDLIGPNNFPEALDVVHAILFEEKFDASCELANSSVFVFHHLAEVEVQSIH